MSLPDTYAMLIAGAAFVVALVLGVFLYQFAMHERRRRRTLAQRLHRIVHECTSSGMPLARLDALSDDEWDAVIARIHGAQAVNTDGLASVGLLGRELKRSYDLLEALNEGLVLLDRTNKVVFATNASKPFLTVEPAEARGMPASACLRSRETVAALDGTAPQTVVDLLPDPEAGYGNTSVTCRASGNGSVEHSGHVLHFRDTTRLREMEQLQQEFVDSIVHEMRTPLTSIRAYVELLIDGEASDPEAERSFYNIIYEETERLSQLIDNLLSISMMEADMIELNATPTRIKRVIEDTLEVIRPQCSQKKISLVVDLPDRLPTMDIDKQYFGVALMNIVSNAVKYTPVGGEVHVSTASHEDGLHIIVRDSGIGISEEDQARVFEKFFRASDAKGEKGSGVGLSTAREVVRLHGGDIRLQSTPGTGSQFTIVMPRSRINTSIGD